MITIQRVTDESDWSGITEIFNHYVLTSTAAYPSRPVESDFFYENWKKLNEWPFYVVLSDNKVVGFCFMKPFHGADTMSGAVVLTYFLSPSHTGKGIGTDLLDRLVTDGRTLGKNNFLVHISSENKGSIKFHSKNGFVECGRFRSVGNKGKRRFDMIWMQRIEGTSNNRRMQSREPGASQDAQPQR